MESSSIITPLIQVPTDLPTSAAGRLEDKLRVAQSSTGEKQKSELKKVSQEFESIFIAQLLKVMRETIEESGLMEGGFGKSIYTDLFDQEVARSMAKRGVLGISDLLYKNLMDKNPQVSRPTSDNPAPSNQVPAQSSPVDSGTSIDPEREISDLQLPVQAPVSSGFGIRNDPFSHQAKFHKGLDLAAPEGMKVVAALPGTVISAGFDIGYGNNVLIQHSGGLQTRYGHLGSIDVKAGDVVDSETMLGKVGNTGRSTGAHLHFEVTRMGKPVDPLMLAGSQAASAKQRAAVSKVGLVMTIEKAGEFGISVDLKKVNFQAVMQRMRALIYADINALRQGLTNSKNVDYYNEAAEFVAPYTLRVGGDTIMSKTILLCTGSKPVIPTIAGLDRVAYLTSDTILKLNRLPGSVAIIGGGYIAAEYGHFLATMGSRVTIIGRNPQFIPGEEPEVSALAKRELQKHMTVITNHEVRRAENTAGGKKKVVAVNRENGRETEVVTDEIVVASGRGSNSDILHPEKAGIKTDERGWIVVDEYLETSQPNVWAFGDADGKHMFKHVANHEALVVYSNAVHKDKVKVDYHAVPHAVFTSPEIASVGLREKEAVDEYGEENILIGVQRYEDTAKGEAMSVKDCFVKVLVQKDTKRILGAHIIGPQASVLIQEIVNLMYTSDQSAEPLLKAMHIHPALSEVVARAFGSLMTPELYHHTIEEHFGLPSK